MAKLDPHTKRQILSDINNIDYSVIAGFLKNDEISLIEMCEAGLNSNRLNSIDLNILLDLIISGKSSLQDLVKAGLTNSKINEIKSFEAKAMASSDALKKKEKLLLEIESGKHNVSTIKNHLLNDVISEEDLLNNTSLTPELINKIKHYNKQNTPFNTWTDLKPIQLDRTDIYFFGQPGSGKSCILASLFSYIDRKGLMVDTMYSPPGTLYKNQLIQEIRFGILPDSTVSDGVNYIPIDIREPSNHQKKHPLNFIEMSGELFNNAYNSGKIDKNSIDAKNYLSNNNQKLIFFILDYHMHNRSIEFNDGYADQSAKMKAILELLKDSGILKKTDGLSIIVSKSDLFPMGEDRKIYAKKFLETNYLSFINTCKEYTDKEGIALWVIPFSIGELKFGSLLINNDETSTKYLFEKQILNQTFSKKDGGLLNWFK